jgi:hypothetical protein
MSNAVPPAPPQQGTPLGGWGPQGPQQPGWGQQGFQPQPEAERPWFKKKRFIIPLVLLVLIVIGSATGGSDTVNTASDEPVAEQPVDDAPAAEAPAEEPAPVEEPAPAEIVTTSQEMITLLEGNALAAKNTYENKQVTVSGFVGGIDASGKYFALDPEPDALIFTGVQVETGKEFQGQLASFSKGQPVTVTGKITNVGEVMGYTLKAETIQ